MEYGKAQQYRELVAQRKACRICYADGPDTGLKNPAEYADFDSDQIGPWSVWQSDLNADLLIVGQDWGSEKDFKKLQGKNEGDADKYTSPTDENLAEFLKMIHIEVGHPLKEPKSRARVFFTNAVLCLKTESTTAAIKDEWRQECGKRFLKRLIEIVRPKLVITLGEVAYRSIAELYGKPRDNYSGAVQAEVPIDLDFGVKWIPAYHPSPSGMRSHSCAQHIQSWRKIGDQLTSMKP
ncbi:MAG: uracil-DNA glycosylase family protein [Chloroflexi bacterium]|nr:uracil-DNA glycosylase family protein [Chloroflexota bacterium]